MGYIFENGFINKIKWNKKIQTIKLNRITKINLYNFV